MAVIDYINFSTLHFPSVLNDIQSIINSARDLRAKDIIIIQLLADGFTILQIAEKIGLNNRTVENRILRLRKKLHCKSITQLAIVLLRANVIK